MVHHPIAHFRAAADIASNIATGSVAHRTAAEPRQDAAGLIADLVSRRQTLGWSIAELGERCSIDAGRLSQWENGDGVPLLDAVQRWAAALGLHIALVPPERDTARGLRVDWPARRVAVDGKLIRLTPMEWKALDRLARVPGQVVTHQTLFHHLYGEERDYRAQSTAIRVLITKLRRLLPLRIEAQWGKGYVLSGIEPSLPEGRERDAIAAEAPAPQPRNGPCNPSVATAVPITPTVAPVPGATLASITDRKVSRIAPPPVRQARQAGCRSEELGVIERFLAERGVTRCPDVATIERSPLPTLVWDKTKRKWVRPSPSGRQAV